MEENNLAATNTPETENAATNEQSTTKKEVVSRKPAVKKQLFNQNWMIFLFLLP